MSPSVIYIPMEMSHVLLWYVSEDHSLPTQQPLPAAPSLGPCALADLHGFPEGTATSFFHKETMVTGFLGTFLYGQ